MINNDTKFYVISAASLMEGVYLAKQECEERGVSNKQLNATLAAGTEGIEIMDRKMPKDVVVFLVDLGNVLNSVASKTSFIQQLQKIDDIDKTWKKEMEREGWTVRSLTDDAKNGTGPGYETRAWTFISTTYPLVGFSCYEDYKTAKAAKQKMTSSWTWAKFKAWCDHHARFTSNEFENGDVFFWINEVYKLFQQQTPDLIHYAPVVARLCVPCNVLGVEWLLRDKTTDLRKLKTIFAHIGEDSALAKAASAMTHKDDIGAAPKRKAGRRAIEKAPQGENDMTADFKSHSKTSDGSSRVTTLVDDASRAILGQLEACGVNQKDVQWDQVDNLILKACIFVLTGQLDDPMKPGKPVKAWTKARVLLRREIAMMHANVSKVSMAGLEQEEQEVQQDNKEQGAEQATAETPAFPAELEHNLRKNKLVDRFVAFLKSNSLDSNRPDKTHVAFNGAQMAFWHHLESGEQQPLLILQEDQCQEQYEKLFTAMYQAIHRSAGHFDAASLTTMSDMYSAMAASAEGNMSQAFNDLKDAAPVDLMELFSTLNDVSTVMNFLKLRTVYVRHLLSHAHEKLAPSCPVWRDQLNRVLKCLEEVEESVAVHDAQAQNVQQFVEVWLALVNTTIANKVTKRSESEWSDLKKRLQTSVKFMGTEAVQKELTSLSVVFKKPSQKPSSKETKELKEMLVNAKFDQAKKEEKAGLQLAKQAMSRTLTKNISDPKDPLSRQLLCAPFVAGEDGNVPVLPDGSMQVDSLEQIIASQLYLSGVSLTSILFKDEGAQHLVHFPKPDFDHLAQNVKAPHIRSGDLTSEFALCFRGKITSMDVKRPGLIAGTITHSGKTQKVMMERLPASLRQGHSATCPAWMVPSLSVKEIEEGQQPVLLIKEETGHSCSLPANLFADTAADSAEAQPEAAEAEAEDAEDTVAAAQAETQETAQATAAEDAEKESQKDKDKEESPIADLSDTELKDEEKPGQKPGPSETATKAASSEAAEADKLDKADKQQEPDSAKDSKVESESESKDSKVQPQLFLKRFVLKLNPEYALPNDPTSWIRLSRELFDFEIQKRAEAQQKKDKKQSYEVGSKKRKLKHDDDISADSEDEISEEEFTREKAQKIARHVFG